MGTIKTDRWKTRNDSGKMINEQRKKRCDRRCFFHSTTAKQKITTRKLNFTTPNCKVIAFENDHKKTLI